MSQPSFALLPEFRADAFLADAFLAGPAPALDAPLDPGWAVRAKRMERLVERACATLARRERRARRLTITVRYDNGRTRTRQHTLSRATDRVADVLPAALGLLRLMLLEHPGAVAELGVSFGALVEGANQPVDFTRYLARKQPQGWARLAGLMASIGLFGHLLGGR